MTDYALDFYGTRLGRLPNDERRRLWMRRLIAWGLVALIHALLLLALVFDQLHWRTLALRPPVETILDLTKAPAEQAPPAPLIRPIVPNTAPPAFTTAPPVIVVPPPPNSKQAVPQTPADILKAIGEALSCGAENFENLNQAERNRCKHEPWIARKLPNGTIVLEAAAPEAVEPLVPKISGGEALRQELQTAPSGCSLVTNVPCVTATPMITIPLN